jgi:hypothetical protein
LRRGCPWLILLLPALVALGPLTLSRPGCRPSWLGGKPNPTQNYKAYLLEQQALHRQCLDASLAAARLPDDERKARRRELLREHREALKALRAKYGLPEEEGEDEYAKWREALDPKR